MYHVEGETHWVDVPFGREDLHSFCSTCSKGSMEDDMVTMFSHFLFHEVSHMIFWIPYDDEFQLITYEMIWANLICSVRGEVLGDLDFILPLEGNIVAAQVKLALQIYHEWRRGQRGVGHEAYHVYNFSPPILHEHKVEDYFQELPSWKVTHFSWLIAWRLRIDMRKMFLKHFKNSIP